MKRQILIYIFSLGDMMSGPPQLRFVGPLQYLSKEEFDIVYFPSLLSLARLFVLPDIIVFHRNAYPLKEIKKIITFAKQHNIKTIFEIDDLVTNVPPEHPSYTYYTDTRDDIIEIMKNVDAVTVTNDRLKSKYGAYNSNIYVLPNLVDERIWDAQFLRHVTHDDIVIGYSGSPTHVFDFKPVIPAIKNVMGKYKNVIFKFIGCLPDELKNMPNIRHIPLIDRYEDYAKVLINANFTFAIAPLQDNEFNQCKSNIKFLEYSACRYPGIYSKAGPYIDSIENRDTGLLVSNTTKEWQNALELFINDGKLREKIAANAYKTVRNVYSMRKKSVKWAKAYNDLLLKNKIRWRISLASVKYYGVYTIYALLRKVYYKILKWLKI